MRIKLNNKITVEKSKAKQTMQILDELKNDKIKEDVKFAVIK